MKVKEFAKKIFNNKNSSKTRRRITMAKNKWVSFFLCLFFGAFGIHKFYEGKFWIGILYLFTNGLFGLGIIIDLTLLLFKPDLYNSI